LQTFKKFFAMPITINFVQLFKLLAGVGSLSKLTQLLIWPGRIQQNGTLHFLILPGQVKVKI